MKFSLFITFFIAVVATSTAELVHPGGWHTQSDLTLIRTKVAAKEKPWIEGWDAIKDKNADEDYRGKVSSPMTDHDALSKQGHAAYVLAMKWVASGEKKYATTAINLIDTWVDTVEDFDVWGPTLTLSTAGGHMAQAAEILAHGFQGEAGWSAGSIAKAQKWFKEVVYPYTSTGDMRSMNWGTSCVGSNMSFAIFCDDQQMFEDACNAYRHGFKNTKDGACGVTQYLINKTGQCYESGRDQKHTQGGIAHLLENAMCAWNQGVDLVSYADYRIVAGVEYTAQYNLGYSVPWSTEVPNPAELKHYWPDQISDEDRGKWSPMYYMCAKLFTLAGAEHPYTKEVIASSGYTPEFTNSSHPGMGTMAFIVHYLEDEIKTRSENIAIPGTIEAEHYRFGDDTYRDTTKGNQGGVYRLDDVDILPLPEEGYALVNMSQGEWLTYDLSVPRAGDYKIVIRYAARKEGAIQIRFKDGSSTKKISLPVTNGAGWEDLVISRKIAIGKGSQRMAVIVSEGQEAYSLDHISIQPSE